jgi:hypothetical protein
MAMGIGGGPGWETLLDEILEQIQKKCDEMKCQFVAEQVKEKFGTLRFYYDIEKEGCTPEQLGAMEQFAYAMIALAETRSTQECMECGKEARIKTIKNWMMCVCEECYDRITKRV